MCYICNMKKLTNRQSEVLDYIKGFIEYYGFSPTIRDIASNDDISVKAAFDHVRAIENKGHIVRNRNGASRSIVVPENEIIVDESIIENNKFYMTIASKMPKLPKGQRCVICGSTEKIERHHEDYKFPEITIDLCFKHHRQLHKIKNILSHSGYKFKITNQIKGIV